MPLRTNATSLHQTYFSARGRGEAIRLALVLSGLEWEEVHNTDASEAEGKKLAGSKDIPFGQWPLLSTDKGETYCQADAIVKHLGRMTGFYGKNKEEDYLADCACQGVEGLRSKYAGMIWKDNGSAEAREKMVSKHCDPATKCEINDGAHLVYLEGFLERSPTQWVAGGKKYSVADIHVFDVFDVYCLSVGEEKLRAWYPKLAAHHDAFAAVPAVADYLKSEKRLKSLNGIELV